MKYGYIGGNLGELVQNFKIKDDKIVITFLDGNKNEINLNEENKQKILNLMIDQAKYRNLVLRAEDLKDKRISECVSLLINMGATSLNVFNFCTIDIKSLKILSVILGSAAGYYLLKHIIIYLHTTGKIKELEKYDIYLSNMENIEKNINNSNLFNGIKRKIGHLNEEFNINTLDNYSLKDIKKIRDNLTKIKLLLSHSIEEQNGVSLTKKISK